MESSPERSAIESVLWRNFVMPGYEACRLSRQAERWHLEGSAVFSHAGHPCRLDYQILCDDDWWTLTTSVNGWMGNRAVDIQMRVDPRGRWWLNEVEQPQVAGCIDIDLNFSPSTNLLPIRRLNLAVGESAEVKAAWLRFPSLALEPFPQQYSRLAENVYRYESSGGTFTAEIKVNRAGLALEYADLWKAEAAE